MKVAAKNKRVKVAQSVFLKHLNRLKLEYCYDNIVFVVIFVILVMFIIIHICNHIYITTVEKIHVFISDQTRMFCKSKLTRLNKTMMNPDSTRDKCFSLQRPTSLKGTIRLE